MRVTLENFRCYKEKRTFDFGETGVSLLSGESGAGKTTIMLAIHFALFGVGIKVTSPGTTSCRVELDFDGMNIVRTKGPNRLVVDDVHEDAEGQEFINNRFGDTFDVTGYIAQDATNSFVMMSPTDKLAFLEKFAFGDANVGEIKGRVKAHIARQNDALIESTAQLDMATTWLRKMDLPEKVEFPIKCKKAQRDIAIKREHTRLQNAKTLISRGGAELKKAHDELTAVRVLMATVSGKLEAIKEAETELVDLSIEEANTAYEGDEALEDLEIRLQDVMDHQELVSLRTEVDSDIARLDNLRKREEASFHEQLSEAEASLWSEEPKDECKSIIKELEEQVSDLTKMRGYERELATLVNFDGIEVLRNEKMTLSDELDARRDLLRRLEAQGVTYPCPSCSSTLRLANGTLQLATDAVSATEDVGDVSRTVKAMEKQLATLTSNLSKRINEKERHDELTDLMSNLLEACEGCTIDETNEDIDYMREYWSTNITLEKRIVQIKDALSTGKFSASYTSSVESLEMKKVRLETLEESQESELIEDLSEAELREFIREQTQAKTDLIRITTRMSKLEKGNETHRKEVDALNRAHTEKYPNGLTMEELLAAVERVGADTTNLADKVLEHEGMIARIEEWRKYNEAMEQYNQLKDEVEACKVNERKCRDKYGATSLLRELILEAESIAMSNIVKDIDVHAQIYLDHFFPDDPLSARLESFRTTKKKSVKPQINITIEHEGMEKTPGQLSGGERSRVVLAYTLALAERFNTPLLLLDECTASLNQELVTVVFDAVRENFGGKLVLVVGHQCISGMFDSVLHIRKGTDGK